MSELVGCRGIHRAFRTGGNVQQVLRGVDFAVAEGEIVSLVGPSGAGKSTLLHILGLLDRADEGEIYFRGRRVDQLSAPQRARIRNREIGFVFQFYHLIPELTALQNVLLSAMMVHSLPSWWAKGRQLRARAAELLERMGMGPHLHKRPTKLSGGERQRVALARALFSSPPVVFCDEPTGNLDRQTAAEIMAILCQRNREEGTAFVLVTHDPGVAARAGRRVHLVDGRIAAAPAAPPPELVIPIPGRPQ